MEKFSNNKIFHSIFVLIGLELNNCLAMIEIIDNSRIKN